MISSKFFFLSFFLVLFSFSLGNAQLLAPPDTTIPLKIKDTVCIKLKFNIGDTLIYNVISFDSVVINFDKPLLKNRQEKLKVICEDINEFGNFQLSLQLISFKSKESFKSDKNIEVFDSPWLNRKIRITVDSVGQRMEQISDDTSNFAISPGGAFQPYLFFPFVRSCKAINETWIVNSAEDLVENGVPIPKIKQFSLFRINPIIDTLNEHCASIEFVKSAQGSVLGTSAGINMNVTSVINGFGNMYLSLDKFIPVYFYTTVEQKLSIYMPNEEPKPGTHYISSTYTLETYSKAQKTITIEKPKKILRKNLKLKSKPKI
jgi:hypothetical protein